MKMAAFLMGAALSSPISALAQDVPPYVGFKSGNDLLAECSAPPGTTPFVACSAYVVGVADALRITKFVCTPQNAVASQLVDIVLNRLRSHPEARHYGAAGEVALALRQTFPCRQ